MKTLLGHLQQIFEQAFESLGFDGSHATLVISERPDLSQFQCNGAFILSKKVKENPRVVAQKIIDAIQNKAIFKDLSTAGNGFINITLTDKFLAHTVGQLDKHPLITGEGFEVTPKRVTVDYGGPNVAKPMHVGHLRSTIIGDCIKRMYRLAGHTVVGDIHLGDWGTQMGMLIEELKKRQPELDYFDVGLRGPYPQQSPVTIQDLEEMYPRASAYCKENKDALQAAQQATVELQRGRPGYVALWKHFVNVSIAALKEDFSQLGVEFDLWNGESAYGHKIFPLVQRLKNEGFAKESENALVIPLPPQDGREIPPLMLVKSDGGFLYATTDLATIEERVQKLQQEEILYVVDQRQALHFQQVFQAAKMTGIANSKTVLKHLGFGTVNGPDGKPFKTRAGGVLKLKDLISLVKDKALQRLDEAELAQNISQDERLDVAKKVGIASLKFADLVNKRTSDYKFDLDRFTSFEGKTGPYLLYTGVRIKSILKKVGSSKIELNKLQEPTSTQERELMLALANFPDAYAGAYQHNEPHLLCEFIFELAQKFNSFYSSNSILHESNKIQQASWITLTHLCLSEFNVIFLLLGLEMPDKM